MVALGLVTTEHLEGEALCGRAGMGPLDGGWGRFGGAGGLLESDWSSGFRVPLVRGQRPRVNQRLGGPPTASPGLLEGSGLGFSG